MSKIEALKNIIKDLEEKVQIYSQCCTHSENKAKKLQSDIDEIKGHLSLIRRTAMFIHNYDNQLTVQEQKFLSAQIMDICKLAEKGGK